ncbi:multicopper oxidase domain-containing protein [Mycobacteroides franklinii]|uniref:multicopper oxidase domain-containing protein n=1 Tax=Mycobacteroides franklinii TaxID=948102 RepID=UPI0022A97A7E|nr:multicopper oxidase domain-containing protein [Mycobacteroides franklinii]
MQRFTEGKTVTIDMHNETGTPKQLHWHGQTLPVNVAHGLFRHQMPAEWPQFARRGVRK